MGQLLGIKNRGRRNSKSRHVQKLQNGAKGLQIEAGIIKWGKILQIGTGITNRCTTIYTWAKL